tara:strand:+ start:741 stop:1355 length:615 start_codon:yes stop_codon:yes gene_type:complete
MSGTTMKVMLKDMFEFIDAIADIQELHHDESLEKLQKKSNNKFLSFNMSMMMTVIKDIYSTQGGSCPCNECHEELKEENEKLKEEQGMSKLVHHQNMGLSEDLKRLKEENEKLKAELNDFTSVFDGNVSMIKMKKENEQLKYELADVQEEKYALYLKWSDLNDENKNIKHELNESSDCVVRMIKMKEENEELKQGIKDLFLSFD